MTWVTDSAEWLEADGLGGFASGTASGIRTRRYHALMLRATTPPTGRMVLVNGHDAWVEVAGVTSALTTQRYNPGVLHPDGSSRIAGFTTEPWPTWMYEVPNGGVVRHEVLVEHGVGTVLMQWSIEETDTPVRLRVRPFLSGRDYHALHRENPSCRFDADRSGDRVSFRTYPDVPGVAIRSNGAYVHAPDWYRNFLYAAERERGLDDTEDLASPGVFEWTLGRGERAVLILNLEEDSPVRSRGSAADTADMVISSERERRRRFTSAAERAADAYLVRRGAGRTLVAGYPWFTDWGRDTFIAMRGLCLALGRWSDARDVLCEWAGAVSAGMLPNRFPDSGDAPEFNAVDASLWYVVVVGELLARGRSALTAADRRLLEQAVAAIVAGYASGTRFGIRMDEDGLLAAGEPGVQLTWMDARVGDRVVTPRIGKPVEIQALWINALEVAAVREPHWRMVSDRARRAFNERFWDGRAGYLADVIDVNHQPGTSDRSFRPNQIFAVGGLPVPIVEGERAARLLAEVEARLLTPLGLRSLAPGELGYVPRYEGDARARDAAYHQGTVWPWLMGAFVEAWVRVRGGTDGARAEARNRFYDPIREHLEHAGLGHVSEIADAEAPFTPRGCPFQAWSLGEVIRMDRVILAPGVATRSTACTSRAGRSSRQAVPAT